MMGLFKEEATPQRVQDSSMILSYQAAAIQAPSQVSGIRRPPHLSDTAASQKETGWEPINTLNSFSLMVTVFPPCRPLGAGVGGSAWSLAVQAASSPIEEELPHPQPSTPRRALWLETSF